MNSNFKIQELNEQKKILQAEIADLQLNTYENQTVKKEKIDALVSMIHDINEEIDSLAKEKIISKNNIIPVGIFAVIIFLFLRNYKK